MRSPAAPRGRLHDLFAGLFEDARRFQRRRRRRYALLVVLAACVAAAGVALFDGGGSVGSGRIGSVAVPRMALTSRALPALGQAPLLSVAGSRLVVSDVDNTSFAHGRVGGTCAAADVDPSTLQVMSIARGSCGNPALFGEHVIPIVYVPTSRNHPGWGVNALDMRVAVDDRGTPTGYRVGPVIVTYPDCSDCRAETIQGDRSLWVYAPMLNPRAPRFGRLLRISLTTGRVVGRWKLPQITRALLATNADGLWLAPSNESGFSEHASAAQKRAQGSLYHVSAGMRTPARVFDVGVWGARWLVANGDSVWLASGRASRPPALWRFDGPSATPTIRGAAALGGVRRCGDLGDGPVTVVGGTSGIFCVSDPGPNVQRVEWLGSSGGRSKVVASVTTQVNYEFLDNAVLYRGGYYFVDPPVSQIGPSSKPVLFRVAHQ